MLDDHSRVVLSLLDQVTGSDYINATFINVSNVMYYVMHVLVEYGTYTICRVMKRPEHILLHKVQSLTQDDLGKRCIHYCNAC